jgi:hypothetical protein
MVFVAYENSGDTDFTNSLPSLNEEDLPPEFCSYHDEGCEYSSSCLECPFPDCIQDTPGGARRMLKKTRNNYIKALVSRGWEAPDIASLFGVSLRTVQRACKQRDPDEMSNEKEGIHE